MKSNPNGDNVSGVAKLNPTVIGGAESKLSFRAEVSSGDSVSTSTSASSTSSGGVVYSLVISSADVDRSESIKQVNDALAGRVTVTDVSSGS